MSLLLFLISVLILCTINSKYWSVLGAAPDGSTEIITTIKGLIDKCSQDTFTQNKFPKESEDPPPSSIETPSYIKVYGEYLKNLKTIKWGKLLISLGTLLTSEQKRKILKDIATAFTPVKEEELNANIEAMRSQGKIISEVQKKDSPYKMAKEQFGVDDTNPNPKELLCKYLLQIPFDYPERLIYTLMCGIKDALETLIFNIKDSKGPDGKPLFDDRTLNELKIFLKVADGMRKETGPITIKLWFWLLIAALIVILILIGVFVFYYFRR